VSTDPRDYVSDNLNVPKLDHLFPLMLEADKSLSSWPWFRKSVNHIWRVDRRNPIVGFISRDEAAVLYSNAKLFAGRKAIEVGALRGWSTVHLLASGVGSLDVVEPLLADFEWNQEFANTLKGFGGYDRARLTPEPSPAGVETLGAAGSRWSFAFIDGDHDGEAPTRDALVVEPFLEPTAMVVFHDLVSPFVAAGWQTLGKRGWNIAAYQTAQMIGIAWRGNVKPVPHRPDPEQATWEMPDHLAGIRIIGPEGV
jgi:predicted O-methyltransferase YrrM